MKTIADIVSRLDIEATDDLEADIVRDSELAARMAEEIWLKAAIPFMEKHPEAKFAVLGPALMSVAATLGMAMTSMDQEDLATMMKFVAEDFVSDAASLRASMRQRKNLGLS
jgi:hypothetical protein